MADLWKPVKGVTIKEATPDIFLFHFAHPLDMEAVLNGGPWTFDNNMLILERVQLGVQIDQIPLFYTTMWVQVHNLPMGLMKENVGVKLANYIGSFVEYDKNNNTSFWRQHMRIRVKIDVRQPLKKETKVKNREGEWCIVTFKYEKLGIFCFLCGIMGHAENKCVLRYDMEHDDGRREWTAEIRADNRRQGGRLVSKWLREEGGNRENSGGGSREEQPNTHVRNQYRGPLGADVSMHEPVTSHSQNSQNQPAFITRQSQLLPNNSVPSHRPNVSVNNQPAQFSLIDTATHFEPTNQQQLTNPITNALPKPPVSSILALNAADTIIKSPYSTLNGNPNLQSLTSHSQNYSNVNLSLPNHNLVFISQPSTKVPPRLLLTINKKSRGNLKPTTSSRTKILNQQDLKIAQPRPDKKFKSIDLSDDLPHDHIPNAPAQLGLEETEAQGEKKRRREEEASTGKEPIDEPEHFLTAGPGSQDCRDQ
jgi:hypothetical protein